MVGALAGLFVLAVVPPFQVPDEADHLYQSYRVSEGRIIPAQIEGRTGDRLPRSLRHLARTLPGRRGFDDFSAERLARARAIALDADDRGFYAMGTVAVYSPVPYLPQALAIALLRPFDARPFTLLYAGRLANLAAALALTWLAIVIAPFHRWVLCLLALTPMAVFERASLAADALTNALAWLVTALAMRAAVAKRPQTRDLAGFAVAAAGLALSKLGYLALALLALMVPRHPGQRVRSYAGQQAALVGAPILAGLLWGFGVASFFAVPWAGDKGVQTAAIDHYLAHPFELGGTLLSSLFRCGERFLEMYMGRLGITDVFLPGWVIGCGYAAVLLALLAEASGARFGLRQRAVALLAAVATYASVGIIFAVTVAKIGSPLCQIQGRHWIPIGPALAAALAWPRIPARAQRLRPEAWGLGLMVVALGASGWALLARYGWIAGS